MSNKLQSFSKKCSDFLVRLFWAIFLCFAFFGLLLKSVKACSAMAGQNEYALISTAVILSLFALIGLISCMGGKHHADLTIKFIYPCLLFLGALIFYLLIIMLMGFHTNQISDFGQAYELSQQPIPIKNSFYRVFSNWAMYCVYLRLITAIFGASPLVGIIWNAILSALSVVLVYAIVVLSFHNLSTALCSAMFFAFWPAHLFYVVVLSPEFVNIFLVLLGILLLIIGVRCRQKNLYTKSLLCFAFGGSLLGLSSFFKSVDKIIYIALGIMGILYWLKNRPIKTNDAQTKSFKNRFAFKTITKNGAFSFLLLLICAFGIIKIGFSFLDYYVGAPVNRNPTAHFLYIGLNPYSNGMWSEDTSIYPQVVAKHHFDYSAADAEVLNKLKDEIKQYHNLNFSFFNHKMTIAWSTSNYLEWPDFSLNNQETSAMNKTEWMPVFHFYSQLYYTILLCFCLIGVIFALIKKERGLLLFCGLFILGFAMVLLLVEVQARYKCVVYPYMAILAGYGFYCCTKLMKALAQKIKI